MQIVTRQFNPCPQITMYQQDLHPKAIYPCYICGGCGRVWSELREAEMCMKTHEFENSPVLDKDG